MDAQLRIKRTLLGRLDSPWQARRNRLRFTLYWQLVVSVLCVCLAA